MASGVRVLDECKIVFQEIKIGHKYRYVVFGISEDLNDIMVFNKSSREADYNDFLAEMTEVEKKRECRYALYDFEYNTKDSQPRNKLVFFMWSPDQSSVKQRMVYASSKDALKKALGEGIAKEVQANDHGDLKYDNVMEIITRTDRD